MMQSDELLRQLRRMGASSFVNDRLFDDHAWIFPSPSGDEYEIIRTQFSEVLKTGASDIAVVGSGKYGYSLSPAKGFRAFQPSDLEANPSDIDLVVVSRPLFNETWHHLRRADYNGAIDARRRYQEHIFRRFIMVGTDDVSDSKYLRDISFLLEKIRKLASGRFGVVQEIKIRVYASWSDAKAYHIWSLQRLGEQHGIQ